MWPNPQENADLVTFTEEILNGKLHFLCSLRCALCCPIVNRNVYTRFEKRAIYFYISDLNLDTRPQTRSQSVAE